MGFLGSLPELVGLFRDLVSSMKEMVAEMKRVRAEKWIEDHRQLVFSLKRAKTDADRWVLLRELSKQLEDFPE